MAIQKISEWILVGSSEWIMSAIEILSPDPDAAVKGLNHEE